MCGTLLTVLVTLVSVESETRGESNSAADNTARLHTARIFSSKLG